MQENEPRAIAAVRSLWELVRPILAAHGGREVDLAGDGMLTEFSGVLSAVRCALAVHGALHEQNSTRAAAERIRIRAGVHLGDVAHRDDRIYGDGVNIAARVIGLSPPGAIAMTAHVRDQLLNVLEQPIQSLGTFKLKNIKVPMELWCLPGPDCSAADLAVARREADSGERRWCFSQAILDERTLELTLSGKPVELDRKSLEVLLHLLQHAGEVVTQEELIGALWPGRAAGDFSLTDCIDRLRRALHDADQQVIRTVPGFGYRFAAPIKVEAVAARDAPHFDFVPGTKPPLRPLWSLVERLGTGGHGEAWLARHDKTREARVFKFALDASALASLKREITLFRVLKDSRGDRKDFVQILDWNLEELPYFIETEYAGGGNLVQWADRQGGIGNLALARQLDLVAQIGEALAAAHAVGVLHKDLKPTNVLVDATAGAPQVRLSDFGSGGVLDPARLEALGITRMGFTRTIIDADSGGTTSGTPLYLAPEVMAGQPFTVQSDVYALGVMLYQIAVGDFQRPLAPGWEADVGDELLREDIAAAAAGNPARRLSDAGALAQRLRGLEQRRHQRRRERTARTLLRGAAAGAVLVLGAGAAELAYWDLFSREHVDYYAGYVRHNGIWQGVDPISGAVAEHRSASYRFVRHGRLHPPERVDYFHGCGTFEKKGMDGFLHKGTDADENTENLCAARFEYHSDGSIEQEFLLNKLGHPEETLTYTGPGLAQFTNEGYVAAGSRSGIHYVRFTRDADGFDRRVEFLQAKDVRRATDEHAFGYARDHDGAGHLVRDSVLDAQGEEFGEVTRYRYDARGRLAERNYLDAKDQPRLGADGYATVRYQYDEFGNILSQKHFDVEGQPATDSLGVAEYRYTWDAHGNNIEAHYHGADGSPALNSDGIAGLRQFYDDRGYRTRFEYLNRDGHLSEDHDGTAFYTLVNNDAGQNIEIRFFDVAGKPVLTGDLGTALVRHKFDRQGNQIEEAFFDVQDRPTVTRYGAVLQTTYHEQHRGAINGFRFLDAEGKPYVRPDRGCAGYNFKRNDQGNLLELECLGADLKPTLNIFGMAHILYAHDNDGNLIEYRFLDAQRRPAKRKGGYAIRRQQLDRVGNIIQVRFFGTDDLPARSDEWAFGWNSEWDRRGRETARTYVDGHGAATPLAAGYATIRFTYDAFGNVTAESYLDAHGAPPAGHRAARMLVEHDAHNRETERHYVDAANHLVVGPPGYASLRSEYDSYGHLIAERCLDEAGKPVNLRIEGWATHTLNFDGKKSQHYFDAAGREVTPRT